MDILGINAFHGDSSAVLLRDGDFASGVEEERLNRIKHWAGFPALAIGSVLAETGSDLSEVAHVAVSRDPSKHLLAKALHALKFGSDMVGIGLINQTEMFLMLNGSFKSVTSHSCAKCTRTGSICSGKHRVFCA